ncbi:MULTISPECIES: TolC family protein [Prevotellaceae]|uniref:TolC family protein n=1 Tax=Segatella copri TaxID=165179 RepID=A0A6A7WD80_9BACT|nr:MULTISPECIES: TolC family protein [Prevotellaceae]MDF4241242.1 TolC family protein [Prevotella sp. B2-R-102]MQP12365.1 TolC family protein [Segatella copri]
MKRMNMMIIGLCGLALLPQTVLSQTRKVSLQECINMALEKNPQMQVSNKSVERAKALQGTAWEIDKTELSLSQDPTSGGSPDNALSLSQSIEFPTYYIARHKQLKAETQAERSKAAVVRLSLENDVKAAYYQAVYQAEKLRVLESQDSLLAQYRTLAEKRYKAGETRQLELLSAERLQRENKMEVLAAHNELETVQLLLSRLVGSVETVEPKEDSLLPLDWKQASYNYSQTPDGQYSADRLKVSEQAVRVAKNGFAPSLSLSLRNQLVISSWNPYDQDRSRFDGGNFMGFEVGVGIPLFYGATRAKVKAARKEREMIALEIKEQEQLRQQEYLSALSRMNAAYVRYTYYNEEGRERSDKMAEQGLLEYSQGEISYLEYMNVLQESIDLRLKRASALNDYNQCVLVMEKLCGRQ